MGLNQWNRYSRQIQLPEFGWAAQSKLLSAKVLVIGAGGLGCPVLQYLVGAGVGTIGIIDGDNVEESNLHRQILYSVQDIGKPKAEIAAAKLRSLNPEINLVPYPFRLEWENIVEILMPWEIILDGTDNFATRYLVNDACVILGKPLISGSIFQWEAQVCTLNVPLRDGNVSPNYRCLFPTPPINSMSCADAGVLGSTAGIAAMVMASETIKLITQLGNLLIGKVWIFNSLTLRTQILRFQKDESNFLYHQKELLPKDMYEQVCQSVYLPEISAEEYFHWKQENLNPVLIDVREPYEYEQDNENGLLIPLSQIEQRIEQIPRSFPTVIHCQSGVRSKTAVELLIRKYNFRNVWSLKGGLIALRKFSQNQ
ncbi:MAG: HesA/MoeB/ThiF family protein [Bacteroidia bacterium]|nr:HesA/MoeB/ThiF family protein [Bacteroidia bacterium]